MNHNKRFHKFKKFKLSKYGLFLWAILLFSSCGKNPVDQIIVQNHTLDIFDEDLPTTYAQLNTDGDRLFLQSVKNRIYEVYPDGSSRLLFDLKESFTYERLYSFLSSYEDYESIEDELRDFRLENFFFADSLIYIFPVISVQKTKVKESTLERFLSFYCMIIALEIDKIEPRYVKSFAKPFLNNDSTIVGNSLTTRLGLSIQDSIVIVRNLLWTEQALNNPELIIGNLNDTTFHIPFEATEVSYKKFITSVPITIDRGFFFGENRLFYSGSSGIFEFDAMTGEFGSYQNQNHLSKDFMIRTKNSDYEENQVSLKSLEKDGVELTYVRNGSIIFKDRLPVLNQIFAIDINQDLMTWVVFRDSVSHNICLRTYKLDY